MKASNPKITVAIPSLNQGEFIGRAIESILEQTIPCEIFVLDGGSSDNTQTQLKKLGSKITYWHSKNDAGQAWAINEGIKMGSAPYVCWLNADDILYPGALYQLVNRLNASPQAPVAYGNCTFIDMNDHIIGHYWTHRFWPWLLRYRCFIAQPATLIRRSAWEDVGGIDESFTAALDFELWCKLWKRHGPFEYISRSIAATRLHTDTKSHKLSATQYRESMSIVKKYFGYIPLKWYAYRPISLYLRQFLYRYQRN